MFHLTSTPLAATATLWLAVTGLAQQTLVGVPESSAKAAQSQASQHNSEQKQPTARQTLFDLRDNLTQVAQKLLAPDARKIAESAIADVDFMVRGWNPGHKVPAEYTASLRLSLTSLETARKCAEEGPAFSALQSVADDLHIKADHCRKSGSGLGGMVNVVVRTKRGEREERNLQVLYMPKLQEVVKDPQPDSFPKFTSPSSHALPPGRYILWAREPSSNMTGRRAIVKVGEGQSTVEWVLPSP